MAMDAELAKKVEELGIEVAGELVDVSADVAVAVLQDILKNAEGSVLAARTQARAWLAAKADQQLKDSVAWLEKTMLFRDDVKKQLDEHKAKVAK
jgi:hypothetical protein